MKVIVECPNTVYGKTKKSFETMPEALEYIEICIENQVKFNVSYETTWQELMALTE